LHLQEDFHLQEESAGSDSWHGNDSDNEGSVACSDVSEMMADISRKREGKIIQTLGKAWVIHGIINTEKDLLHTYSD
jgi:hypothetical protein